MIQNIDVGTRDNQILGFKVSGKVDGVSFKRSTGQVLDALDSDSHFNLYLEVESLEGLEFQVIWDSMKLAINNLGDYLKQVDKIAVVTDIDWFKRATTIENALIPSISEKVFPKEKKEEALNWLKK